MPITLASAGELVGRILLASLFVLEGISKLRSYATSASYMESFGLPGQLLPLVIALELGGSVLIVLGWHTRIAALAFAAFCVAAAIMFHTDFAQRMQVIQFEKNLALAGAFLILAARGAGAWSLDARGARNVGTSYQ